MYRPRREHFCSISTSWSMLSIKSTRVILRPAYCVSCSHRFRIPNNAMIGQLTSELRSLVGVDVVRKCIDCGTNIHHLHGNMKRCFICKVKWRRLRHRRLNARMPTFTVEPKVPGKPRVTATQIAAYLQMYAPSSYRNIVERIQALHHKAASDSIKETSL